MTIKTMHRIATLVIAAVASLALSVSAEDTPNIVQVAIANGFSTLVAAIEAAGLTSILETSGPITVFAPTNAAFDLLGPDTINDLLSDRDTLSNLLLYHVVGGALSSMDLLALGGSVATTQGEEIMIDDSGGTIFLNDNVQVVGTDVMASNGVVHVIDRVLVPPSFPPLGPPNIVEIATNEGFDILVQAVVAAGLATTLMGSGPFTVFAPTNEAFEMLGPDLLNELLTNKISTLQEILMYHVVGDAVFSSELRVGKIPTLQGDNIRVSRTDYSDMFVLNRGVNLIAVDVVASNGVVHVIDQVLLPPSLFENPGGESKSSKSNKKKKKKKNKSMDGKKKMMKKKSKSKKPIKMIKGGDFSKGKYPRREERGGDLYHNGQ